VNAYEDEHPIVHRGPLAMGLGVGSLVGSAVFLVCCMPLTIIALVAGIGATWMSAVGMRHARDNNALFIVGLITGILGILISSVGVLYSLVMFVFLGLALVGAATGGP
jgi:hypothetical protein